MGMLNLKDIKEIKDTLVESCNKGFFSFLKTLVLYISVAVVAYMILNIEHTIELFTTHRELMLSISFVIIVLIYELSKDRNAKKQKALIDSYIQEQKELEAKKIKEHDELVKYRFEIGPKISNILKDLIIELDATRASISEMHNGTNNLAGLPFLYADMVYEEVIPGIEFTMEEYKNINLAKYHFISNHYNEGIWVGTRDEIEAEDKRLAVNMTYFKTEYFGFMVLYGKTAPLGFLTVSFSDKTEHPNKSKIIAAMNHASQKISTLLDFK